ncbi:T-complex protein 1 subunit gamma [Paramicrosporidium saccamoebae]|uniref:T-complex protein 1 subunit gamma n=1 Tax=Paramicrosporidium saccamoebae TaxID=1246581 RepID=A0A2H9TJS1_9FUNG|nr:T-complex protein 1 subunit gamma [Paramicrosporidium saccamoebae]
MQAPGPTVADVIRTCLGPQAMLKMVMDPMGGIVLTNDGNAILREIEVVHPAAKSMLELCRAQDEEVGDGTTSVIILSGEMLACMAQFLERKMHPITIIAGLRRALEDAMQVIEEVALPVNLTSDEEILKVVRSSIGTKIADAWSNLICDIAIKAVRTVYVAGNGKDERKEVDIKQYAKVEKIPGGDIEDCCVLDGVMFNKDIIHPQMRRRIENPRIVLLDCPLEYKKGESQTNIEITKEVDWQVALEMEEKQIRDMCDKIIELKPDVLISEKGISDLAQHYLTKANISAIRRVRKTDNNRISRATGATIVNRIEDIKESDIGTGCGLFHVEKIGDEYFTYLTKCKSPKACTIVLRGPSKDILSELERNLQDAMHATRNLFFNAKLCPGGGATEVAIAVRLEQLSKNIEGVEKWPYKAVASAIEVIPRTLIQNCGGDAIRLLTELKAKHAAGEGSDWGIDGVNAKLVKMTAVPNGVWESVAVKSQTIKTAIESACMILRVDDIVAGLAKKQGNAAPLGAEAKD